MWGGHPSGKFTISSAWEKLRKKNPVNPNNNLIWYPGHIPRQAFILWLAARGRLQTLDRLQRTGITSATNCILCNSHPETHEHLFFQCSYSKAVWEATQEHARIKWPAMPWSRLLRWASTTFKGKKNLQGHIARTLLSTTVYSLWLERNKRTFRDGFRSSQHLTKEIIQCVRLHLTSDTPRTMLDNYTRLHWNVPT